MKNNLHSPKIRLSDEIKRLEEVCQKESICLEDLMKALGLRGHAFLTLFFAFPFLLPIPVPGLSILFGIVIAFIGFQMAIGKDPWVPTRWKKRPVSTKIILAVLKGAEKILSKLEKIVKPRGKFLHSMPWTKSVVGMMISICGLFLALPLPPGTNLPPGACVILMSLGYLEKDDVFNKCLHSFSYISNS